MKAKELIRLISELNPDKDTEIDILLHDFESGLYDFLDVQNVVRDVYKRQTPRNSQCTSTRYSICLDISVAAEDTMHQSLQGRLNMLEPYYIMFKAMQIKLLGNNLPQMRFPNPKTSKRVSV